MSATTMPRWGVKWVRLDVAVDAIAVGVLDGSSESAPRLEKVAHDEVSIRRLVTRLGEPSRWTNSVSPARHRAAPPPGESLEPNAFEDQTTPPNVA